MKLSHVSIKNFKSLSDVRLENVSSFNVIIGKNNSGKSSVFGALSTLNNIIHGRLPDFDRTISDRDRNKVLEIGLSFIPYDEERNEYINNLTHCGLPNDKLEEVINSAFLRQVDFLFRTEAGSIDSLHLRETKIKSTDGQMSILQRLSGDPNTESPESAFTKIAEVLSNLKEVGLQHAHLNLDNSQYQVNHQINKFSIGSFAGPFEHSWPLKKLLEFLEKAYFFKHYRNSTESLAAQEVNVLDQDGTNLTQRLLTLRTNNTPVFEQIEKFVQEAVPELGILQTPLVGTANTIAFRRKTADILIPLKDMGGGIEQILMIATVLLTTDKNNVIFLEEPESHLHAGAQKFLIERLYRDGRQVFIATHSPTFINTGQPGSLYKVTYQDHKSLITTVTSPNELSETLDEIGSQNSDLLLSDAVLFVEGSSDRDSLLELSKKTNFNLAEKNITVITLGGGQHFQHDALLRTELLNGISAKSPVPHLFILDRDERTQQEIRHMKSILGAKLIFWKSREIENYLLVASSILEALKIKYSQNATVNATLASLTIDQLETLITEHVNELYSLVLLKRVRHRIPGFLGGFMNNEIVEELRRYSNSPLLFKKIRAALRKRSKAHIDTIDIENIVREERSKLDTQWAQSQKRKLIAPGEEVLSYIFKHVGGEFKKPSDTVLIAKQIKSSEIDIDVKNALKKAYKLLPD